MLRLKKLRKTISGVTIIDGLSAAFPAGKVSAIIGPNGAGKTTLFHLITGELQPDAGDIIYHQDRLNQLLPHRIARRGVGRLFQDVRIFAGLSTRENIITACYAHDQEFPWYPVLHPAKWRETNRDIIRKAETLLTSLDLIKKKDTPAEKLSFGQQKLLAIGRLLAAGCNLLLFDEPTSGLHPAMTSRILDIIKRIISEDSSKTIIIVEHNMKVVSKVADWVFFMNEGRIAFTGRTDHVLGCRDVREMYLGF